MHNVLICNNRITAYKFSNQRLLKQFSIDHSRIHSKIHSTAGSKALEVKRRVVHTRPNILRSSHVIRKRRFVNHCTSTIQHLSSDADEYRDAPVGADRGPQSFVYPVRCRVTKYLVFKNQFIFSAVYRHIRLVSDLNIKYF